METDEILKDLNEQQREAVQFKDGQCRSMYKYINERLSLVVLKK